MRTKPSASGVSALLSVAILTGCGDDDPRPAADAAPPDAPIQQADAGDMTPDAGTSMFDKTKKAEELSTGITMTYVEAGNTSGGEVVIMLHGYTDTARSFFPTIETLVADNTDLHIYALDQRGHGGSSMPDDANCPAAPEECFEPADMAEDVIAFMDAKEIDTAHIVGHSMSSLVAQELGLGYPSRIESLMLIGTWVYAEENPTFNDFLVPLVEGEDVSMGQWRGLLEDANPNFQWPADAYELTAVDADANAAEFMKAVWVTDVTADPAFLAEIVPETIAHKLGSWIGALRTQHANDTRERLAELTVPALVIWGTQDFLFPVVEQDRVKAALDGAVDACNLPYYFYKTYAKLPLPESGFQETDIGHNVQWGAYEAVAADITAWAITGEPTEDLPYADPANAGTILNDPGAADIIEKRQADLCTPVR
jgi:pimeloyl-ACP methyl ester carboxylesterase